MDVKISYNNKTLDKIENANDRIMYAIARRMIDQVGNLKATAYRSGETERSMFTHGVGQDDQGYYIGNFTSYASSVYKLKRANWTNKLTKPQWFHTVWKEYGDIIQKEVAERYLDDR